MKLLRTALLFLLLAMAGAAAISAVEKPEKTVYHINDSANASALLNNVRNHLQASPKAQIVVVAHGGGIDFLLEDAKNKNGNPYDAAVQELSGRHNVQFRVCNNTLESRKIDKDKLLPEASIVPSGVAEVARLQTQEGYAYLKP
jgi:hypothetical protein